MRKKDKDSLTKTFTTVSLVHCVSHYLICILITTNSKNHNQCTIQNAQGSTIRSHLGQYTFFHPSFKSYSSPHHPSQFRDSHHSQFKDSHHSADIASPSLAAISASTNSLLRPYFFDEYSLRTDAIFLFL